MSEFQNPVQLLADLVKALDNAHISSWQSTAAWDEQLKAAREYIAKQRGLVSAVGHELLRLEQQRDDLLTALESLIDMDVAYNRGPKVARAVENAIALIGKVKGGAE